MTRSSIRSVHDPSVVAVEAAIADLFRLANDPRHAEARRARAGTDLSATALEVLRRVDDGGPITVSDAARVTGLSLPSTSRTLADLERRGLLHRSGDPTDGRVARFETTRDGRATRQRFQRATQDDVAAVLDGWSDRDRERLAVLFVRLVEEMQAVGLSTKPGEGAARALGRFRGKVTIADDFDDTPDEVLDALDRPV